MQKTRRPLKQRIFNLDSKWLQVSAKIFDLMNLNFLFLLSCLPLVTIGPALIALYQMTVKIRQGTIQQMGREYYQQFRANLKQGFSLGLCATWIFVALFINSQMIATIQTPVAMALQILCYGIGFISFVTGLYSFQISGIFETSFFQLLKSAFYLGFLHFSKTLALIAILLPVVMLLFFSPVTMLLTLSILLFIGFSMIAYVQTGILHPVFEKYRNEN
ncbi:YesL family protein [Enterococcus sp. LJL98]